MTERSFSRRQGGMRFRPKGGLSNAPSSTQPTPRPSETADKMTEEPVFDHARHAREIERAENIAAGLPPEGAEKTATPEEKKVSFREPNVEVPEEVNEEPLYEPVKMSDAAPKTFIDSIKQAASRVIQKVTRLIRPRNKMHKEIIINSESLETRVSVLEDGKLEEFTIERTNEERLVGSIYKGKVRNLEDGLKAAFVDIGFEKNSFLHYWDIIPNNFDSTVEIVERENKKRDRPRITQRDIPRLYPIGSEIVIQVTKGPIGTKGPRVTTNLSLPGRFLVLLPNSDQSGISRKIENHEERLRLKKILRGLSIPEGMGVIIRTAGEGQQARYFVRDLAFLLEEWKLIQENMTNKQAPSCVFQEPDLIERTVRDFLTEGVDRIVIDNEKEYNRIRSIIGKISPRSASKVKLYAESQGLFDRFNISRQLEAAFARQVHLKGGGYIVIDETEALVAIDVNTGSHKSSRDQESTILRVNLEAAEEICRQLRLRNIGGLIVLDYIDMKSRRDQQHVLQRMKEGLRRDKAKTHLLPISQLGLMEMTRQRHSESVRAAVYDDCLYCKGRGKVKSTETMSVEIQRKLSEVLKKRERDESDFQLKIVVHPSVMERLRNQDEKFFIEMEKKYYGKMAFRAEPALHPEDYRIINAVTNEEIAKANH